MVTITIDKIAKTYPKGTTYETIAEEYQKQYDGMIALVLENGKIRELMKPANKDCTLTFLTLKDTIGHKTYVRTALMTLIKAAQDVLGTENVQKIKVEFVIGQGYYLDVKMEEKLTDEMVKQIGKRMRDFKANIAKYSQI